MNLKAYLFNDDRGVSPVIGVILMVAITVILAAVIATFVMNMGPPEDQAPTTSWDGEYDDSNNNFILTHDGGGGADAGELKLIVSRTGGSDVTVQVASSKTSYADGDTMTASNSLTLDFAAGSDSSGTDTTVGGISASYGNVESIELIWESSDSDQSEVLGTWEK